jgi:hypothetical protein
MAASWPLLSSSCWGRQVGDDRQLDRLEVRRAAPPLRVGLHLVGRADVGPGERVRAGADVVGLQPLLRVVVAAVRGERGRAHHLGPVRRGEVVEERRVRRLELDNDLGRARRLDRRHVRHHVGRALVDGAAPVEGGLDGGGGEWRPVVERHALAQGEGVGGLVRRDLVGRRETGGDLRLVGSQLVRQQPLVQILGEDEPLAGVVDVGVRRLARVLQEAQVQHLVGRGRAGHLRLGAASRAARRQHG